MLPVSLSFFEMLLTLLPTTSSLMKPSQPEYVKCLLFVMVYNVLLCFFSQLELIAQEEPPSIISLNNDSVC